jgi:hypothetical protein
LDISPRQVKRLIREGRDRAGAATTSELIAMLVCGGLAPAVVSEGGTPGEIGARYEELITGEGVD